MKNKILYNLINKRRNESPQKSVFCILQDSSNFISVTYNDLFKRINYYIDILSEYTGQNCVIYAPLGVNLFSFIIASFYSKVKILVRRITNSELITINEDLKIIDSTLNYSLVFTEFPFENDSFQKVTSSLFYRFTKYKCKVQKKYDFIQLTSGTSSDMRAECLSLAALLDSSKQIQDIQQVNEKSILFSYLTLSHIYGFCSGFILPLLSNSTCYIADSAVIKNSPMFIFETIKCCRITHLSVIIHSLKDLLMNPESERYIGTLKSLKCLSLGGEKLDSYMFNYFSEKLKYLCIEPKVVCNSYGMSEVGAITMGGPNTPSLINYEDVSVGKRKYKNLIVNIFDHGFSKTDSVGYIGVSCKNVAKIYYQYGSLLNNKFIHYHLRKYYLNGDLVYIKDNELYVSGRSVNTLVFNSLKITGEMVNSYVSSLLVRKFNIKSPAFFFNYPNTTNIVIGYISEDLDRLDIIFNYLRIELQTQFHFVLFDCFACNYNSNGIGKLSLNKITNMYKELISTDNVLNPLHIIKAEYISVSDDNYFLSNGSKYYTEMSTDIRNCKLVPKAFYNLTVKRTNKEILVIEAVK